MRSRIVAAQLDTRYKAHLGIYPALGCVTSAKICMFYNYAAS